ncbi:CGNR zinc finger domain-containing protein [Actinomadura meridiana]|uniref:CGNR zinc finger domain-containing protein n=1 Tax=Actinomadura meridiana TaxID=559626 RepID=A0ABP8C4Z1_9ACTN
MLRARSGATYRFDPGALCLELLTTGGPGVYRHYEVLHQPADLVAWAERSRLEPTPELEVSDAEVSEARRLRDALFGVVLVHLRGEPYPGKELDVINAVAARPALAPAVGVDGERAWAGVSSGTQLLATVARDAVELLTGPFAHRIRACAADNCQLVYVDTSRPGRRRWCSMEHCGNLHKVRAIRARQSSASAADAADSTPGLGDREDGRQRQRRQRDGGREDQV